MTRATRTAPLAESPKARDFIPGNANLRGFCDCRKFAFEGPSVEGQLLQHYRDYRGICGGVLRSLSVKQMDLLNKGLKKRTQAVHDIPILTVGR
jgi:hypothetical protein